jgi:hypothetical protein
MPAKKAVQKKVVKKVIKKAEPKPSAKEIEEAFNDRSDVPLKECAHCEGIGKCTEGEPYDKGHHQMFGSKVMLTSCPDCLEASGEHRNSKKIVACRICKGTGKVEA